jgi:FlaG/FlaF family flagellin (archaellin)
MVAITVILAAVIAAFVFGMAGNITKTKVVAATAQQPDANSIIITYQGGQDASSMINMTVNINDAEAGVLGGATGILPVGSSKTYTGSFAGKDHVVCIGYFSDGTSQVIMDNTI